MNKNINILFFLLIGLSACSPRKPEIATMTPIAPISITIQPTDEIIPIGDGGLITGQPCASPCFFGIRLGETSFDQVVPILENNGIYPCNQVNERNIFCGTTDTVVVVAMNASTFMVDGISYKPSASVLVEDIIARYGDPNSVHVELDETGTPESPKLLMSLLWDSVKIGANLVGVYDSGEHIYVVENTAEVHWVFLGETTLSASLQPWKGYGNYKP